MKGFKTLIGVLIFLFILISIIVTHPWILIVVIVSTIIGNSLGVYDTSLIHKKIKDKLIDNYMKGELLTMDFTDEEFKVLYSNRELRRFYDGVLKSSIELMNEKQYEYDEYDCEEYDEKYSYYSELDDEEIGFTDEGYDDVEDYIDELTVEDIVENDELEDYIDEV